MSCRKNFLGTQKRVRISHGKRVIGVRVIEFLLYFDVQSNFDGSNTDGSFTMANSNSFLSPYEIPPLAQENKYLRKFSYFIVKLYVVCTH